MRGEIKVALGWLKGVCVLKVSRGNLEYNKTGSRPGKAEHTVKTGQYNTGYCVAGSHNQ